MRTAAWLLVGVIVLLGVLAGRNLNQKIADAAEKRSGALTELLGK